MSSDFLPSVVMTASLPGRIRGWPSRRTGCVDSGARWRPSRPTSGAARRPFPRSPDDPVRQPGSTGSPYGFLFSVPGKVEGFGQVQGRLVEWQLVHRRPQIQHVALGAAVGLEALENVLAQVRREGRLGVARLAVDWAGATPLQTAAAQTVEQSQ